MKNCPNCGGEVKDNAKFCRHCGNKIEQKPQFVFCDECGAKLEAGSTFCDECGARLDDVSADNLQNGDPWSQFKDSAEKVVDTGMSAEQYFEMAQKHEEKGDFAKAFLFFKKSAEKGDVRAQKQLFNYYNKGIGGQEDKKLALHWIEQAAYQGDEDALLEYAYKIMYGFYDVCKEDPVKSLPWMKKAFLANPSKAAWGMAENMVRTNPFDADEAAQISLKYSNYGKACYIYQMASGLTGELISKLEFGKLSADYDRLYNHQQYCKKTYLEWKNK